MPYTEILENCVTSIGGIKDFYLATVDVSGNSLNFPLDVILESGSTNTILASIDYDNRIITINTTQITFRDIVPKYSNYFEEEFEDRRGKVYRKTLEFSLPKVNLLTNNQLKQFLFTDEGEFAVSNAVMFFTDSNNQTWISGWDLPLVLQDFNLDVGARGEANEYNLRYVSNSYRRTFKLSLT